MFRQRLSSHFLLIDFLFDRANYLTPKPLRGKFVTDEALYFGSILCTELLEPLIYQHGPMSIAAGIVFEGTDQHALGPHGWQAARGAAADIVLHNWVNDELDPAALISRAHDLGIKWTRWIAYAGTEFSCLAYHPRNLLMSTYINRRPTDRREKPQFRQLREPTQWENISPNPNWRREPGETVFHTRRAIRPQHVRVGHYFTLLDFCRSETALEHGLATVPPPTSLSHIISAHQAAHILDPVVRHSGRLSVILGIESATARARSGLSSTEWRQRPGTEMECRFVFSDRFSGLEALEVMGQNLPPEVTSWGVEEIDDLVIGYVRWLPFDVPRWFTSARVPSDADQETIYQAIEADRIAARAGVLTG